MPIKDRFRLLKVCIGRACLLVSFLAGCTASNSLAAVNEDEEWWWPVQKEPATLTVMSSGEFAQLAQAEGRSSALQGGRGPHHTLAQSVAGLAAQAVNRGAFDELLWIEQGSAASAEWLRRLTDRLDVPTRESPGLWELVDEYHQAGVIEGYVVYRLEPLSRGDRGKGVDGDQSVNTATMLAGIHRGILVDEEMEAKARELGLEKLADARAVTSAKMFEESKDQMDKRWALVQSPCMSFGRDQAIAHRMPVTFGTGEFTETVYASMPPGALVIGWNNANEDESVIQLSRYGHTLIPSDWSPNMATLAAGAASRNSIERFSRPAEKPSGGESDDERPGMGLFMSDGDNLQWLLTNFTHSDSFWANPRRGEFPMAWGLPIADLIQNAPDVYDFLVETQTEQDSILVHLGYYYPDVFGSALSPAERERSLRLLGARVESTLRSSGAEFLTFLVHDLDSDEAMEAYQIIADSSPSLKRMFAIQYHPYEGGAGRTYEVTAADGREVAISTARYALWADTSGRERAGDLETLPKIIEQDVLSGGPVNGSWVVLHAWSRLVSGDGGHYNGMTPAFDLFHALEDQVKFMSFEHL